MSFAGSRDEFYEDVAEALDDRAQLAKHIDMLAARAEEERDLVAPLFRLWSDRMLDMPFSEALKGTVPRGDVMLIGAAEKGNRLADGLRFTATVNRAIATMVGSLRKAVMGFAFMSLFLIGVLVAFSFYGIPLMEALIPPKLWPWSGKVLKGMANLVTSEGVWFLGIGSALTILYVWSLPNWRGTIRVAFDKYLPIYTIYRDFHGALFLVSLAALMRNKKSLNGALEALFEDASPWLRWHIEQISLQLDYHSKEPGRAFATGIFSRKLTNRIIDFGARSSFPVAIEKVGLKSIDAICASTQVTAKRIQTFLMFVSALLLGFIMISAILTMQEAQGAMQKQLNMGSKLQ